MLTTCKFTDKTQYTRTTNFTLPDRNNDNPTKPDPRVTGLDRVYPLVRA